MKDYKIAQGATPSALETKVKSLIRQGYVPNGSITSVVVPKNPVQVVFMQPMFKS